MEHKVSAKGRKDYEKTGTTGMETLRGGQYRKQKRVREEKERERKRIKVKSLRLIELEVTDRVPSAPGATNLMQLLYNSLYRLALTTNRTISEIELPPRKFSSPSPSSSSRYEFWIASADLRFKTSR